MKGTAYIPSASFQETGIRCLCRQGSEKRRESLAEDDASERVLCP